MTRFIVRPTDGGFAGGYSVVDTNREDMDCSAQIGRGLDHFHAADLAKLLNSVASEDTDNKRLLAIFAACADAHDEYLSDDEKRAAREAAEKSAEQASRMPAALRLCLAALERFDSCLFDREFAHARSEARKAVPVAREALGE